MVRNSARYSSRFLFLPFLLSVFILSCSSPVHIEKRHFRDGFYIDWHKNEAIAIPREPVRDRLKPLVPAEKTPPDSFAPPVAKTEKIIPDVSGTKTEGLKETAASVSVQETTVPDEKPQPGSKDKQVEKKKSSRNYLAATIIWFSFFLITAIILAALFASGGLPFGGIIALIICVPLMAGYLTGAIVNLSNYNKSLKAPPANESGEQSSSGGEENKTKQGKTQLSPEDKVRKLVSNSLILLICTIYIPVLQIVSLVMALIALEKMKKLGMTDQKLHRKAVIVAIISALLLLLLPFLFVL